MATNRIEVTKDEQGRTVAFGFVSGNLGVLSASIEDDRGGRMIRLTQEEHINHGYYSAKDMRDIVIALAGLVDAIHKMNDADRAERRKQEWAEMFREIFDVKIPDIVRCPVCKTLQYVPEEEISDGNFSHTCSDCRWVITERDFEK